MRYKIDVPKDLFHETVGLMGDLGLFRLEADQKAGVVYIEIKECDERALVHVFTKLLGPAGLTFEPAPRDLAPAKPQPQVTTAKTRTKRR